MADRYANFAVLAQGERNGIDYRIRATDRGSAVAIIAPHGGYIEPGTSQITAAIAQADLSFYAFEGLRPGRVHGELHITSTRFDEPQGRQLVEEAETAIAIHGRVNNSDPSIWIGGRHQALGRAISDVLSRAGFAVSAARHGLAGESPSNICNRGRARGGVQLEIPRTLRDELVADPEALQRLSSAVREAIETLVS